MGFVSDVAAVFAVCGFAWLGLESCCCLRLSEAVFQGQISRLRFSLLEAIFSCLFLLNGFCKRRFGSFCGCGFAGLGLESCCCLRFSEAVFQGQISRLRFSLLEAIFSWFCVTWARILLLFEAFGSGLPRSDFETKVFFAGGIRFLSLSFEWFCKRRFGTFGGCGFAWLGFESCCCLRLSEAVFQGQISRLRFSLLESIFSCLFLLSGFCKQRCGSFCGCGFAWLGLESCCCLRLSEAVFQGQISRLRFPLLEAIFSCLFLLSGFCMRRFGSFCGCGFAWLGLESCCCLRLSEAVFQGQISRLRFSLLESIFSCLFLLSGFCKRRCGSFCGCGFAWLGLESCCCLRLSEAVFQGQISRLRFSLLEAIFSCLFLLSGFCKRRFGSFCGCGFAGLGLESCCCLRLSEAVFQGQISRLVFFFWVGFVSDVSAVLAVAVLRDLGSNPAAVWGFRKRSSKVRFRD